jgi:hypothetical protein
MTVTIFSAAMPIVTLRSALATASHVILVCLQRMRHPGDRGRRGRHVASAKAAPCCDHTGMTSGLVFGNFAMVASLTFRCWATIAGGVRAIQSDSETSAK